MKIERLKNVRIHILDKIKDLSLEQLNKIPSGYNNNIVWNLGHLIWAQQNVCYHRANLNMIVDEKYINLFKPSSIPLIKLESKEIENIKSIFIDTIDQLAVDNQKDIFNDYQSWTAMPYGFKVNNIQDAVDFITFHEGFHLGYITALKRFL